MGKIKPGAIPSNLRNVQKPALIQTAGMIHFSFKHLDLASNEKFGVHLCANGYLPKLLERLRDLCGYKTAELKASKSSSLRVHPIDWRDTSEPNGFDCLNQQLRQIPAWQFEITANAHGRVHGFFLDDIFFVVWVDPNHQLYRGQ
jgi:hypothetical protein